MAMNETGTCAMCGNQYEHFGNNPEPIYDFDSRVCHDCNNRFVIPVRLGMVTAEQTREQISTGKLMDEAHQAMRTMRTGEGEANT